MEDVNVYLSVSMDVSEQKRYLVEKLVEEAGGKPYWWVKGTPYTRDIINKADIFVLVPNVETWNFKTTSLTTGVLTELSIARSKDLPIFCTYVSSEGLGLYSIGDMAANSNVISLTAGTRRNLAHFITNIREGKEIQTTKKVLESIKNITPPIISYDDESGEEEQKTASIPPIKIINKLLLLLR